MKASITTDPTGKPSTMRVATLIAVGSGCAMLIGAAFGGASLETTKDALWLIAIAFGGKAVQRMSENKE